MAEVPNFVHSVDCTASARALVKENRICYCGKCCCETYVKANNTCSDEKWGRLVSGTGYPPKFVQTKITRWLPPVSEVPPPPAKPVKFYDPENNYPAPHDKSAINLENNYPKCPKCNEIPITLDGYYFCTRCQAPHKSVTCPRCGTCDICEARLSKTQESSVKASKPDTKYVGCLCLSHEPCKCDI